MQKNPVYQQQLREVIPFRFLDSAHMQRLVQSSEVVRFEESEAIIRQGDTQDRWVYVLLSGSVSVGNGDPGSPGEFEPHSIIEQGHYFGEWEAIFEVPRVFSIRAATSALCCKIPGNVFLSLVHSSGAFAQSLATILKDRQGIFQAFDRFRAEVLRGVSLGHITVSALLDIYRSLEPALHRGTVDDTELDLGGLEYAVRRLPENVTRTFAFLLRDELPTAYKRPGDFFPRVDSTARRRSIWEMLPGKDLVLLRNGMSDLMDFITCLCLYAVEAQKIRKRMYAINGMTRLKQWLQDGAMPGFAPARPGSPEYLQQERQLLWTLGFDDQEIDRLYRVWPRELTRRIYEITNHREMFSIDIRRQKNNYNSRRTEIWTGHVGSAVSELLGCDAGSLPEGVGVHIISSNTHSVTNCLNAWYLEEQDRIISWAKDTGNALLSLDWSNPQDKTYALLRDYFRSFPDRENLAKQAGESQGIKTLSGTLSTGIQVQIIDASRLAGTEVDPGIGLVPRSCKDIIVNIDYAFGEQAEHIIRNLILLFGHRIESVNFLGKAGSLAGKRGDILVPTAFLDQAMDQLYPVPTPARADTQRFTETLGGIQVHTGPMLTVEGTLLQNRLMLQFYRHLWAIIGLEMEGSYYHRQVAESIYTGLLRKQTKQRFYYYVSDLPLAHTTSSLANSLQANEGIPPLYAITREILRQILRIPEWG
ncbi:DUF6909 family protein [Spirochaeta lutea]|uniref:Cyclic nucleotide-binding domain-containing protein n=1 Tax=Spirochaeta lutea TaxID=1480694 RepID=A0A098QWV1_9SPIO|nr:cyclic nucleotide-binding domain-containing protein [Spirochaeta lutea]KGE71863.1 hypothetical protein DC28_08540 [Spirochaeta lutea]